MDDITPHDFGLLRRELRDVRAVVSNIDQRTRTPSAPPNRRALLGRLLACHAIAQKNKEPPARTAAEVYGNSPLLLEALARPNSIVTKAATVPAQIALTGWAAELATPGVSDRGFLQYLTPTSVYSQLSARPGSIRVNLTGHGSVKVPTRQATPTLAGPFVAENAPIPMRQGGMVTATITLKKAAVVSMFTRELLETSIPNIESVVTAIMGFDTAIAIDGVLLGSTAVTTAAPAGLLNGVSATTATAGGGIAAFLSDIRALALAIEATGPMFDPVLIMSSSQALILPALLQGGVADMPIIASPNVTAKTIIMLDAANFASAEGDTPDIMTSKEAVIHQEDTTPLNIGTAGSPNTVAAPSTSMFQIDCVAIRLTQDATWAMTRSGRVAYATSVTW